MLTVAALLALAAPAAAHPPYGLAADRSGSVYFSDLETVWRLSPDGRLSVFRPHVPDTHVHEVVLAPDGAIEGDQNRYDPATQRFYTGLWRRTPDGRERMLVPMAERPPAGFGPWQDRRGNRYASFWPSNDDRRTMLMRRAPDGRAELVFAEGRRARPAAAGVASVGGMAGGADGSLWFADRNLLRQLRPDGSARLVWRGPEGSSLRGLALARDGRVLAADMGTKAVVAVAADGTAETLYREEGPWLPTAAAEVRGRLLVLEANADPYDRTYRVRVIEVTGREARVVAAPGGPPKPGAAAVPEKRGPLPLAAAGGVAALASAAAFLVWRRMRGR
jgi:hypothetical protein